MRAISVRNKSKIRGEPEHRTWNLPGQVFWLSENTQKRGSSLLRHTGSQLSKLDSKIQTKYWQCNKRNEDICLHPAIQQQQKICFLFYGKSQCVTLQISTRKNSWGLTIWRNLHILFHKKHLRNFSSSSWFSKTAWSKQRIQHFRQRAFFLGFLKRWQKIVSNFFAK